MIKKRRYEKATKFDYKKITCEIYTVLPPGCLMYVMNVQNIKT